MDGQSFDFTKCDLPVPDDLGPLFRLTWEELAEPGNGWDGIAKVELARVGREARANGVAPESAILGGAATRGVDKVVNRPAETDEAWVKKMLKEIGLVKYIELIGWVSMVTGVDTITQLLGIPLEPLPDPKPGSPEPVGEVPGLRQRRAWVPITGLPLPRISTSAVPRTQTAANRLIDRLYILPDQSREVEAIRGLPPVQLELAVSAISHANKCFYCTLGHLITLQGTAGAHGLTLDTLGIVDPDVDIGVEGAREIVAMARSAVTAKPDPTTLLSVAEVLGPEAAVTAAEIAGCFNMINRLVEATGQPALANQRERMMPMLQKLGVMEFPHSGLTIERKKPGLMQRFAKKLRA